MEEKFLHAEEPEEERNSRFQTRRDSSNSSAVKSFTAFNPDKLKDRNTFSKDEKLKSRKTIELIFNEGKSFHQGGFTLIYLPVSLSTMYPVQAGFTVSKSNFKKATDRNRIKRCMREAYRLHKLPLYRILAEKKQQMALMFIYKGKSLPDFKIVETTVKGFISKLSGL